MMTLGYHETIAYRVLSCTGFTSIADAEELYRQRPNDLAKDELAFKALFAGIKAQGARNMKTRKAQSATTEFALRDAMAIAALHAYRRSS